MTLNRKSTQTDAEKILTNPFLEILDRLPNNPQILEKRKHAFNIFEHNGLPSRKIESWHYTDLRVLLKTIPAFVSKPHKRATIGVFAREEDSTAPLNVLPIEKANLEGVTACSILDAIKGDELNLPSDLSFDDTIGQVNTSYFNDGWVVNVRPGVTIPECININNFNVAGQNHARFHINVGAGATCCFVEKHVAEGQNFATSVTNLTLDKNADVTYVIIHQGSADAVDLSQFNGILNQGAKIQLFLVDTGGKLIRQEANIDLVGEKSDLKLRGINLLGQKCRSDVTMIVRHLAENTSSTEVMRNVVTDQATGAFQGLIRVAQQAQKTDAGMVCNSLFLSDNSEYNAKPELEIFADDVACGHGATVTEIDKENLFYLTARGIPEPVARGLLTKAFVAELIDEVQNEVIKPILTQSIQEWLETHIEGVQ